MESKVCGQYCLQRKDEFWTQCAFIHIPDALDFHIGSDASVAMKSGVVHYEMTLFDPNPYATSQGRIIVCCQNDPFQTCSFFVLCQHVAVGDDTVVFLATLHDFQKSNASLEAFLGRVDVGIATGAVTHRCVTREERKYVALKQSELANLRSIEHQLRNAACLKNVNVCFTTRAGSRSHRSLLIPIHLLKLKHLEWMYKLNWFVVDSYDAVSISSVGFGSEMGTTPASFWGGSVPTSLRNQLLRSDSQCKVFTPMGTLTLQSLKFNTCVLIGVFFPPTPSEMKHTQAQSDTEA